MTGKRTSPNNQETKTATKSAQRGVLTRVNLDGWRALSQLTIERDTSLQALAIEAFNDLLVKYGKRPVVGGPKREED